MEEAVRQSGGAGGDAQEARLLSADEGAIAEHAFIEIIESMQQHETQEVAVAFSVIQQRDL